MDLGSTSTPLTIANGASVSDIWESKGRTPVGLLTATAWTAAAITILGSDDGTNFYSIWRYQSDGTAQEVAISAGGVPTASRRIFRLDPADFQMITHLKLQSGTEATPVNQGAARVLDLLSR